jgi:hypothetical protein
MALADELALADISDVPAVLIRYLDLVVILVFSKDLVVKWWLNY